MSLFTGLSAFPLTPTDQQGQLMPNVLGRHLERIVEAGTTSIGLLGSTGAYAYLTTDQRKQVVRIAARVVNGRTPIIVGVGALRTNDAADLARDAADAGAAGLLLAPMSYQKLTDDEVFAHFQAVAVAAGLPLCIYNNPTTTNFTFSQDLIRRLSDLPSIAAIKMPLPAGGDYAAELASLRAVVPDGFLIGYSGDWGAKDALVSGADSWFSVAAGLFPKQALRLARAAMDGDVDEAGPLDQAFQPLWTLFKEFGSFRVMYSIAQCIDDDLLLPLRPVMPLSASKHERVRAAVVSCQKMVGEPG